MRIFKLILSFIIVGFISYFGFVLYLVFSPDIANYMNRTEFDSERWKNWEETEVSLSLRWDMTHDLPTNYKLIGISTDDVFELLGKPSRHSNSEIRYYLGFSRHGIDTGSLVLKLEDGKVVNYRIWHG